MDPGSQDSEVDESSVVEFRDFKSFPLTPPLKFCYPKVLFLPNRGTT